MKVEDFNYTTECNACDGDGELPKYDPCPACYGEGEVHRLDDAPENCIRLYEGTTDEDHVTTTEIPITDDDPAGFKELYGDKDLDTIIEQASEQGNSKTEDIFRNIKDELGERG